MPSSNRNREPDHRRLPPPRGFPLVTYRLIWLVVFVAALTSIAWFDPRNEARSIQRSLAAYAVGFGSYSNLAVEGLLGMPFDAKGLRADLRPGDLLLAVDGRRMPQEPGQQTMVLSGPTGSIATLALRHPDGERFTLRVARDPDRIARAYAGSGLTYEGRRWVAFAVRTLAAIAALAAATLLFLRRPDDPVAQLLSFSLVLGRATLLAGVPGSPDILTPLQPVIANILLSLAILLFPSGRFGTRWHAPALAAVLAGGAVELWQYLDSSWASWSLLVFLLPPTAILAAVARQLRLTPPGIQRQQTKFVLFGIVGYAVLLILSLLLLVPEALTPDHGIAGWFTLAKFVAEALAGVAIPAGLLISLLRYRLYDAETAISRSVAYGALTLALIAVFAASQKVIEIIGEAYLGGSLGALAGALAAALAAATIVPLHGRVTRWAERRFQGALVHLRRGLPVLVGDMRETATPEALAEAMLVRLKLGVRSAHGAVVAGGEVIGARDIDDDAVRAWMAVRDEAIGGEERLHADRADPLFPMRVPLNADGFGRVGWLLLGPRPDGSFYGKDERETLAEIADPVARALAIALERERRETESRARETARQAREDGLQHSLESVRRFLRERFNFETDVGSDTQPI